MDIKEILSKCDHTDLSVTSAWEDIKTLCDDAVKYGTASVCIPPFFVKRAKNYVGDKMRICTVIGFPNGYSTTVSKCFETCEAVASGADEIDMVINIGLVKAGLFEAVLDEIKCVRSECVGKILKVIIETCCLSEDEIIKMCGIVTEAGADYIKTSTGFSKAGAVLSDVELMKKHVGEGVKVKAAGGIRSIEDAEKFLLSGADRLGTSSIVKIVKTMENGGK